MKSALNDGLNLSIRDGWLDEWCDGEIPSANSVADEARRGDLEVGVLYDLLEHAVVPKFYERDERGVLSRGIEMVRHTLQTFWAESVGIPYRCVTTSNTAT
ncbi:hypothetical protein A8144_04390 [Mycobacterium leprae 3125609]|uniref:B1549_C3_231 n=1 Tax=Mycobacterium leprae TaxID=1769 RepID=Q49712_MYCLR|nr:B1549_C3_231 [Mycobacterium leprae]OAR19667.1 hypothetical protein A8144_04390 [Mycobacterium leprae 3125609]OAX71825.1 hypothetical protein A3216_03280 [Mycobacterium leprae 7935681]